MTVPIHESAGGIRPHDETHMKHNIPDIVPPIDLQACVLRAAASYARGVRADMVRLVGPGRASLLWTFDAHEPVSPRAVVRLVAA